MASKLDTLLHQLFAIREGLNRENSVEAQKKTILVIEEIVHYIQTIQEEV